MNKLIVSPSPHASSRETVPSVMYGVVISLLPALGVSVYYFGMGMLVITLVSVLSCILFEYLIQKFIMKVKPSHLDGSAILTGLLLAFCLPANLPFWMVMIGALVAIGIGKMTFGGIGNNIFNPALVGRVFLFISFPVAMTSWPEPGQWLTYTDAVTGATPLGMLKEGLAMKSVGEIMPEVPSFLNLFLGNMMGSSGEVAAFALLIGMIYLLVKKIITWHIPVSILGTVFIFTGILWLANPDRFADPLFHMLTGGLMLGRHLHGHRLRDFAHDGQGHVDLRDRDRDRDRADQGVRGIPGGGAVCHPDFQRLHPAVEQVYQTQKIRKGGETWLKQHPHS